MSSTIHFFRNMLAGAVASILLAILPACACLAVYNAGAISKPVLLGKQGEPPGKKTSSLQEFSLVHIFQTFPMELVRTDGRKIDSGVMGLLDAPGDVIRIEEITFSASTYCYGGMMGGRVGEECRIQMSGAVYRVEEGAGHEQ